MWVSYIKTLDPNYKHPNYRCDFLITFRNEDKPKVAIIEYDGFEFHFENLESVNKFNYENYYTERDIERERILESYGFPFIRFNRFNLGKNPVSTISNKLQSFFFAQPLEDEDEDVVKKAKKLAQSVHNKEKKKCRSCKKFKAVSEFRDPSLKSGIGTTCKKCKKKET